MKEYNYKKDPYTMTYQRDKDMRATIAFGIILIGIVLAVYIISTEAYEQYKVLAPMCLNK